MSNEEIIERLDKMAQHHEICGQTFAPDFHREKYQAWGQTLREAIVLLRTHPPAGDNADKSSDTSARLAAIKDIPTRRLIELAVAETAGLISISPSAAERARQDVQPNEPLTQKDLLGMDGKWVWLTDHVGGKDIGWARIDDTSIQTVDGWLDVEACGVEFDAYRRPPKEA